MKKDIKWKYLGFAILSALSLFILFIIIRISIGNLDGGLGGAAVALYLVFNLPRTLQGQILVVFLVSLFVPAIFFLIKFVASILEALFSKG